MNGHLDTAHLPKRRGLSRGTAPARAFDIAVAASAAVEILRALSVDEAAERACGLITAREPLAQLTGARASLCEGAIAALIMMKAHEAFLHTLT